jgi:hypothetical protein
MDLGEHNIIWNGLDALDFVLKHTFSWETKKGMKLLFLHLYC